MAADIEPANIATVPDSAAHKLESDSTSASYSDKCLGDDGIRVVRRVVLSLYRVICSARFQRDALRLFVFRWVPEVSS